MDVLPLAVSAMPDTSFLRLAGSRPTLAVNKLGQADVSDAGCVLADQVDVRVQDGGVDGLAVLSQNFQNKTGENKARMKITQQHHRLTAPLTKMTTDSNKMINLTVLKVESMKIHPFHQVAQRLRLKRSQSRVADLAAGERAGHVNETKQ